MELVAEYAGIITIGRWSAWGVLRAALKSHVQALGLAIPYPFLLILPHVLTRLVLTGYAGKLRAPVALGVPLDSKSDQRGAAPFRPTLFAPCSGPSSLRASK